MGSTRRANPARMRRPLALRLVPVLVPGVLLAALPHLSLGPFRILAVLQALLPLWCVAALLVFLFLALRRAFVPAAVLLVLAAASLAPVMAPSVGSMTGTRCTPGEQVRVLSLNAEHGRADTSSLAEVIRGSAPDVLVLVESSEPMLTALAAPDGKSGHGRKRGHRDPLQAPAAGRGSGGAPIERCALRRSRGRHRTSAGRSHSGRRCPSGAADLLAVVLGRHPARARGLDA